VGNLLAQNSNPRTFLIGVDPRLFDCLSEKASGNLLQQPQIGHERCVAAEKARVRKEAMLEGTKATYMMNNKARRSSGIGD
jgi:hypothetical protein